MSFRLSKSDPGSYSNPEEVHVSHMDLFLDVDFSKKTLAGYVLLTAVRKSQKAEKLILDSRDLFVEKVTTPNDGAKLNYSFSEPFRSFGRKLSITLPKPATEKLVIKIEYHTDPDATALYWLQPNQTVGGKLPYLFSQCQPDHCRSMIPCQDSSGVKGTYNANISVPEEFTVVMSAMSSGKPKADKSKKRTYKFNQNLPVPAYLIAIAVGNLSNQKIGPRSTVWTEPELIEKAVYEFEEIELLLKTAEDICGPYEWKIYDILVLPPAFPFGGMENACVTFVTPTVLVGDRSLLYVIAHEIAHSWSGNSVSVKNYEHFWLNEGLSTFIERKIGGRMKGEPYRHLRAIGGIRDLRQTVNSLGGNNPFTQLVVNLSGNNPDDAFSKVVYEKGHTFLFYLEDLFGGTGVFLSTYYGKRGLTNLRKNIDKIYQSLSYFKKFEPFLRSFFVKFTHKSVDTNDFKSHLMTVYKGRTELKSINWDQWLFSPGMPHKIPEYDKSLQIPCTLLVSRWIEWGMDRPHIFKETDLKSFMSEQVEEFVAQLLELVPIPIPKLRLMDHLYKISSYKNSEIRVRWYRVCIRSRWLELVDLALSFVIEQGQVKYAQPIFRDLFSWEETREKAVQTFNEHKSKMSHILVDNIQKDMDGIMKLSE